MGIAFSSPKLVPSRLQFLVDVLILVLTFKCVCFSWILIWLAIINQHKVPMTNSVGILRFQSMSYKPTLKQKFNLRGSSVREGEKWFKILLINYLCCNLIFYIKDCEFGSADQDTR